MPYQDCLVLYVSVAESVSLVLSSASQRPAATELMAVRLTVACQACELLAELQLASVRQMRELMTVTLPMTGTDASSPGMAYTLDATLVSAVYSSLTPLFSIMITSLTGSTIFIYDQQLFTCA